MTEPATCILCPPGRGRLAERGHVDNACRAGLPRLIADVRILAEKMTAPDDLVPDRRRITTNLPRAERSPRPAGMTAERWAELDKRLPVRVGAPRDPVAAVLPSGAGGVRYGAPTSGGDVEARMPIAVNRVDLTLPAQTRDAYIRGLVGADDDQVGHLPLLAWVRGWVQEWGRARGATRELGGASLPAMLRWLAARAGWACDVYDPDELVAFVAELRAYRSTMRHQLGLVEEPEHMLGVTCPGCRNQSLYRENGSIYIECVDPDCGRILTRAEYLKRARTNVACLRFVERLEAWQAQRMFEAARSGWRWREAPSCYRPVGYGVTWPVQPTPVDQA